MNLSPSNQPVAWIGLVETVLVLAVVFGLQLSPEQIAAILAVANSVAGVLIWHRVSPVND